MKTIFFIFISLLLLTGCVLNTKNLSFDDKNDKNFRVSFNCTIPFTSIRKVNSFEEKNTTKDEYYVEFANIYESHFSVTKTYLPDADFSNESYVQFIEEEGFALRYQKNQNGILYIKFEQQGKIINQIVSATRHNINIINVEPMMFDAIKSYCAKK